jgi:FkbM family methyltransferase
VAVLLGFALTYSLYSYSQHVKYFKAMQPQGLSRKLLPQDLKCPQGKKSSTRYDVLIDLFIEPIHPIDARESVRNLVYLPSVIELTHPRLFFIDCGARDYHGSTGDWFVYTYQRDIPRPFQIFAFEPDPRFERQFRGIPNLQFLAYAVSTSNGTAKFGGDMGHMGAGDLTVKTIDFSDFLTRHIRDEDFLVVKMDIEGAEMDVLPWLIKQGTVNLIDELFVELHPNVYKAGPQRDQQYKMITQLREHGVYAHEWQ